MSKFNKRVSKQINGSRSYRREVRTEGFESTQNSQLWITRIAGSVGDYDGMLEQSVGTGGDYTLLGDSTNLPITSTTGNVATFGHQSWRMENYFESYKFTNICEHPVTLSVYEFVSKQTRALEGAASADRQFLHDYEKGHDLYLSDGTKTSTVASQDAGIAAVSSNQLTVYSSTKTPTNSHTRKFWKMLQKRKIVMNPGDTATYKLRVKGINYDPSTYKRITEGTADAELIAGITKTFLFAFHGPLGRSSVAGEHATVGLMTVDVGLERMIKCKIIPLFNAKRQRWEQLDIDDLTGKTLVGPTEHELLDDVN